jgi:DNA-binding transcriptional regulator YhcF (GntR family)
MIVQDLLPPGARIRKRTLAKQLEVSRTLLREALKVLATEGLVELLPNRGALVADPSPIEIRDMLQVLGVLEAVAGELACSAASAEEIAEIKALHYEMLAAFARNDRRPTAASMPSCTAPATARTSRAATGPRRSASTRPSWRRWKPATTGASPACSRTTWAAPGRR